MIIRIAVKDYKQINWFQFIMVKKTQRYVYLTERKACHGHKVCLVRTDL